MQERAVTDGERLGRRRRSIRSLVPLLDWLPRYDAAANLRADLVAGVAVAALLIPESMGYADVAGVPAEYGLYAALVAVAAYAVFGRSSILVVGPASAVAALSASIVAELGGGQDAIIVTAALALLSGVLLVVAGALRFGWIVNFISRPVLEAFIAALSISIIIGQLDGLVGHEVEAESAVVRLVRTLAEVGSWTVPTVAIGVAALALLLVVEHRARRVPAALVVLGLGIAVGIGLDLAASDVAVVGVVPQGLPEVGVPELAAMRWLDLLAGGAALLLVGYSEGYAIASTLAARTGEEVDADQELIASGAANIASGLVGGLAVGGSLSKSAAAQAAGARTQVTNLVAGLLVLATLLFLAPLFRSLPEPVLAAIVIAAVLPSANPGRVRQLWSVNRLDFAAALLTFVLVLVWEALPALIIGVLVSLGFLVRRATFPDVAELRETVDGRFERVDASRAEPGQHVDPATVVVRFEAPIVYPNAAHLRRALASAAERHPDVRRLVLDAEMVADLDATGAEAIEVLDDLLASQGVHLLLARVHSRARSQLERSRLGPRFAGRLHPTIRAAVDSPLPEERRE